MRERVYRIGVILLLSSGWMNLFFTVTARAEDWPSFLGPNRNGLSKESEWNPTFPKEGPEILWRAQVGTGFAAVTVAHGLAYVAGNEAGMDTLYCFDAVDGTEVWKFSYPCPLFDKFHEGGPAAAVTVDGERIYHLSRQGEIRCFEARTGDRVWEKELPKSHGVAFPDYGFSATPLIEEDWVIVDIGKVFALDKKNGEQIWESEDYLGGYGSPLVFDLKGQRILAVLNAPGLTLMEVRTGITLSQREWHTYDNCNTTTPVLVGENHLFLSTGYNRGCGLFDISDPNSIQTVYENPNMNNHFANSILVEGHFYGFDGQMHKGTVPLKCLKAETGDVVWSTEQVTNGALIVADGSMIILTENGELVTAEVSPSGYTEISRAQVFGKKAWTMPVLANGRIYCRNAKGDVVCVSAVNQSDSE